MRHEPLDGCQEGNGIVAGTAAGAAVTVTIANNMVVHYQKNGITVRGAGSTATITGNTVTGEGPTTQLAQNGIQVSSGAIATVTGNTVSGNECNGATCGPDPLTQDLATGILLFQPAAGTMVMGNTLTTNDVGIYNLAQGTTLMGNTLTGNRFQGIVLDQGDATVASNTVSGPIVSADCNTLGAGINVLPAATANIHDNTITDVRHEPLERLPGWPRDRRGHRPGGGRHRHDRQQHDRPLPEDRHHRPGCWLDGHDHREHRDGSRPPDAARPRTGIRGQQRRHRNREQPFRGHRPGRGQRLRRLEHDRSRERRYPGRLVLQQHGRLDGQLTCNQISGATEAGIRLLQQTGGANAVATATNNSITGNAVGIDNTTTSSMDARRIGGAALSVRETLAATR